MFLSFKERVLRFIKRMAISALAALLAMAFVLMMVALS